MITVYLRSFFNGKLVGEDEFGTKYYEEHRFIWGHFSAFGQPRRKRRWAVYKEEIEASSIPAYWHGWLHYTTDQVPDFKEKKYAWQKSHQSNLTGTSEAYRPKGSILKNSFKENYYEAWTPGQESSITSKLAE